MAAKGAHGWLCHQRATVLSTAVLILVVGVTAAPSAVLAAFEVLVTSPDWSACGSTFAASTVTEDLLPGKDLATGLARPEGERRTVTIVKPVDRCSPILFLDAMNGTFVNQITISFVTTTGPRVTIASIQISRGVITAITFRGADLLAETVTLGVTGQLSLMVTPLQNDGKPGTPLSACWDFQASKPC
jgi:Type VI secretion system effector, Hcp